MAQLDITPIVGKLEIKKSKKSEKGEKADSHTEKAPKWYPAEDVRELKKTRKTIRPTSLRENLKPGTVLILLAGRFRGKRVILLNNLDQGVLLVTGPFKINGVPIRRVNARYVIATSTTVNVKSIDKDLLKKLSGKEYFAREKSQKKTGEDAFFKQGDKPEKKETAKGRVDDQKKLDKAIISEIKKQPLLASYLASSFSLRKGDKPHEMKF